MRQRLTALIVAGVLTLLALPSATTAAECQFILGFATLKALIDAAEGPDKVGDCLENQRFNPENGDALQQTTGGLLVWRKADNWTAFTDGYRTWINGPYGLQARLNTETFDWEGPATPPTLTVEQLENAEYRFGKLTDGVHEKQEIGLGSPVRTELLHVEFGDLNGDGIDDAVVLLLRHYRLVPFLAAVVNEQGRPRHVGSISFSTLETLTSMLIQDGRIIVQLLIRSPGEPLAAFPSHKVIRTFRLEGDTLTLLAREVDENENTGGWVQYEHTDPLTDEKRIFIGLRSYDYDDAYLRVHCHYNRPGGRANVLYVSIFWDTYLGSDELVVLRRFDKYEKQQTRWIVSTGGLATFAPEWEVSELLWYMKNTGGLVEPVSNLVARVERHDSSTITAQWHVAGFPAASLPLAEHCGLPGLYRGIESSMMAIAHLGWRASRKTLCSSVIITPQVTDQ